MKKRKIAFAVCIVIIVLSVLCFIWAAFSADSYHGAIKEYEKGSHEFSIVLLWYSFYICVTLFNLMIICGTVYLFVYFYRNDFSVTKEDRERIAQLKKEKRKQAKIDRLKKQKDQLQKQLNNLNK